MPREWEKGLMFLGTQKEQQRFTLEVTDEARRNDVCRGTGSEGAWLREELSGHSLDFQSRLRQNSRRSNSVVHSQERDFVIPLLFLVLFFPNTDSLYLACSVTQQMSPTKTWF